MWTQSFKNNQVDIAENKNIKVKTDCDIFVTEFVFLTSCDMFFFRRREDYLKKSEDNSSL